MTDHTNTSAPLSAADRERLARMVERQWNECHADALGLIDALARSYGNEFLAEIWLVFVLILACSLLVLCMAVYGALS